MKFHQFKNHRNTKYMSWLRTKACVVSSQKAQCAHHIRLGTNGGSGLKPSDYFCIPLLNEYHTSGVHALHLIGEETFLEKFNLCPTKLFTTFLLSYLKEEYNTVLNKEDFKDIEEISFISFLVDLIEQKRPKAKARKTPIAQKKEKIKSPSITENEFYQKAKEEKKLQDKKLRQALKVNSKKTTSKKSFKGNEFYERAKELKKQQDKELRKELKSKAKLSQEKKPSPLSKDSDYYQRAKEAKKEMDKKLRAQNKERTSKYRKEQYKKLKQRDSQA